ncbi:MAG: DUF5717 family protein, partial [Defluviitaleaceae bacterium]|nr:DUF5717 family protein [Defluviitaleaceae bacterium]
MESTALRKIADFEKIYGGRPVGVAVFAMALRYLVGFVITGRGDLLHRAHYLLAENKVGASRPDLIFFRGILGRYLGGDEATKIDELLDEFKPFRNTMRQNQPEYYSLYLYFSCYYEILRNRERAAHKAIRALETYCETHPGELGDMLQALAYLDFGDFDTAHAYLSRAYGRGCHSPFLYLMLAKIYGDGNVERPALLMPFIKWAICQGFDADKILNRLQRSTERVLAADLPWAQRVYAAYPHDWILRMICLLRMGDGDLSETAYYYYKEAETRQLFFDGLIDFLIHAAHENGIEEVSRYSLELF